ncbi:reverse transcriptase domain-containing protein [Tanacetum coccineum]
MLTLLSIADALAACDADRSMNGDDNHNSGTGVRRNERVARECTYPDFMKCQPLNFKGTKGVVELTQWTVSHDVAYAMTWTNLKKKMTDKYCPRSEIKKLEVEIWNMKVKGTDMIGYNQHFQELALLCVRMFPGESDKIERYVGGLPNMIHRSVVASKPKTMQEAIEMATELMDKKIRTFAERRSMLELYHCATSASFITMAANCKRVGYLTRDCRSSAATNNQRNLTFYECGNQGHYRSDCSELKNQDHGNQARGTGAHGMVHALGGGETNQDLNDIEDDINA